MVGAHEGATRLRSYLSATPRFCREEVVVTERYIGESPFDQPEQLQNAMTYGLCRVCKAPREARTVDVADENGNRTGVLSTVRRIVCPNGHPQ